MDRQLDPRSLCPLGPGPDYVGERGGKEAGKLGEPFRDQRSPRGSTNNRPPPASGLSITRPRRWSARPITPVLSSSPDALIPYCAKWSLKSSIVALKPV